MRTIDFDYHLPEELIADRPLADRAASRMLVVHRDTGLIEHRHFHDIMEYVQPGDHFVLNNTKVVPARYFSNDGSIELVRAGLAQELVWKCLVRPGKKMKVGAMMFPLRMALTGCHAGPGIDVVMQTLGRDEVLRRIEIFPC